MSNIYVSVSQFLMSDNFSPVPFLARMLIVPVSLRVFWWWWWWWWWCYV